MNHVLITIDFEITTGHLVAVAIIIFLGLLLFFKFYSHKLKKKFYFSSVEAELSKSPSLKLTLDRDESTLYLASRIWIELKTRKVPLSFEKDDSLMELYDSWYELFQNLRIEIKNIPGQLVRSNKQWHQLISITVAVLNEGLRPHLTRYHSRFEAWYLHEQAKPERQGQTPQTIQEAFPEYATLVAHLHQSNKVMESFVNDLEQYILEA